MAETVRVFDVDWMRGMSFGIFPIETSDVESIAKELDTIFANDSDSPSKGMVRFMPNKRLKAILVITSRPEYLRKTEVWLQRIDLAAEATSIAPTCIRCSTGRCRNSYRSCSAYTRGRRPAGRLLLRLVWLLRQSTLLRAHSSTPIGSVTLPVRAGGGVAPPLDAPNEVVTLGASSQAPVANEPGLGPPALAEKSLDGEAGGGFITGNILKAVADDRDGGISFVTNEGNNAIVVSATPGEWRRIRQVLS